MSHLITSAEQARTFIFAGNSNFTLESEKTGDHFTFKVRKAERGDVYFVKVLTGPNNDSDYRYASLLRADGQLKSSVKSLALDAPSNRALQYALAHLQQGRIAPHLKILHTGRCGRCGRKLTVPESIESGLGPECAGRV